MKLVCDECGLRANSYDEVLTAKNPFNEEFDLFGCPTCFSVDQFNEACDEPDCWEETSAGFKDAKGIYRRTCGTHFMKYCPDD